MKIGILTFHEEFNYGSFLQAYALQTYIASLGHQVVFLNHHVTENDDRIKGILIRRDVGSWYRFFRKGICGGGAFARFVRLWKTRRLIRRVFNLTSYRFYQWRDAPKNLGVDLLVVGSDQLWSAQWTSPAKYLLDGAPDVPAITYAVSMGLDEIPKQYEDLFRRGVRNFKAISVREKRAAELIGRLTQDVSVAHVVDPTLLVGIDAWDKLCGRCVSTKRRSLFCYLMGVDFNECLDDLIEYAKCNDCEVHVFTDHSFWEFSASRIFHTWGKRFLYHWHGIHVHLTGDPVDFILYLKTADWVLSDSFHALMFSLIFRRNIRVLAPVNDYRVKMFSRIEEAADSFYDSRIVQPNLKAALSSFTHEDSPIVRVDELVSAIERSYAWLKSQIGGVR